MTSKKTPKNAEKFVCESCHFVSSKKSDYERHITTRKHKILTNTAAKSAENAAAYHVCICGKQYKHRQSLYTHAHKCTKHQKMKSDEIVDDCDKKSDSIVIDTCDVVAEDSAKIYPTTNNEWQSSNDYKEMFIEMIKQNNKLQQQMIELIPQVKGNTTNNTMNNFNINLFLNEECKDALNIMDFVNSLTIELTDLERTGTHGFADGLSNIFVKAIRNLDVTKRPIHCTDLKREILYVKDNETWNKDSDDKKMLKTAIQTLKQNNVRKITEWVNENPESKDMNNPKNEIFMNIVHENTGNQDKNITKIIRNVAKNVMIAKIDKS